MRLDPEIVAAICDEAGLVGRPREVLELHAQGLDVEEIAARLSLAVNTIHVNFSRARAKIRVLQSRTDAAREWFEFLLHDGIPNHAPTNPPTPNFIVTRPGWGRLPPEGERVRVRAARLTVEELMEARGYTERPSVGEGQPGRQEKRSPNA